MRLTLQPEWLYWSCPDCDRSSLPYDMWRSHKASRYGITRICKGCHNARNRSYKHKNQSYVRSYQRDYDKKNPRTGRSRSRDAARRRARLSKLAYDSYTRTEIFERDNFSCWQCGKYVTEQSGHIDHLVPLSSPECPGDIRPNVAASCVTCNLEKSAKLLAKAKAYHELLILWYREISYLSGKGI